DPAAWNACRRARSIGRDQFFPTRLGASAVVDAVDPNRRRRDVAPAQSGADRLAISSPTARYLVAVLMFGSAHDPRDPVSPAVVADRLHRADGAVVARARLLADRAAVLEARADRAASGGGGGSSCRRAEQRGGSARHGVSPCHGRGRLSARQGDFSRRNLGGREEWLPGTGPASGARWPHRLRQSRVHPRRAQGPSKAVCWPDRGRGPGARPVAATAGRKTGLVLAGQPP